jgi:hypothetical protein
MSLIINYNITNIKYNSDALQEVCFTNGDNIVLEVIVKVSDANLVKNFNDIHPDCFDSKNMVLKPNQLRAYLEGIDYIKSTMDKLNDCYNDIHSLTLFNKFSCMKVLFSFDSVSDCLGNTNYEYVKGKDECIASIINDSMVMDLNESNPSFHQVDIT